MSDPAVYLLGEAMLELAPADGDSLYRLGVAGDSFNTAVALAQLGVPCEYLSGIGDDAASRWLLAALDDWQVGRRHLETVPGAAPGLYLVHVDAAGERSFSYWRQDSAAARLFRDPERVACLLDGLSPERWLYLSGISLAIASPAVREQLADFADGYRRGGGKLVFDCNYRAALWPDVASAAAVFSDWFARSDLLLPGLDDLAASFNLDEAAAVDALCDVEADIVVLKRGALGPLVLVSGEVLPVDGEPVETPVDATGAGDAFNGAMLAALLQGQGAVEAAGFAHELAAAVVQHTGAIMPRERWEAFRNCYVKPE